MHFANTETIAFSGWRLSVSPGPGIKDFRPSSKLIQTKHGGNIHILQETKSCSYIYILTKHALKIKQGQPYTHDKNDWTQKMASGSTNFVEELTVSINNIILINMM